MNKFENKIIFILVLSILLLNFSCNKGEVFLGKIPVEKIDNIYIKLYQEREIDSNLAVEYEVFYKDDSIISRKCFLFGTADYLKNANLFKVFSSDSIIFMTYHDSTEVNMILDLKSMKGNKCHYDDFTNFIMDRDSLFDVLKNKYPYLKANWK